MRLTLRGPLGWALAAGLVIAACGSTPSASTAPSAAASAAASSGPRIGSFDRPVVLAFTPSQEAAQEFRILNSTSLAEYGRALGGFSSLPPLPAG